MRTTTRICKFVPSLVLLILFSPAIPQLQLPDDFPVVVSPNTPSGFGTLKWCANEDAIRSAFPDRKLKEWHSDAQHVDIPRGMRIYAPDTHYELAAEKWVGLDWRVRLLMGFCGLEKIRFFPLSGADFAKIFQVLSDQFGKPVEEMPKSLPATTSVLSYVEWKTKTGSVYLHYSQNGAAPPLVSYASLEASKAARK